jgi:hypothetical protein
MLVHICVALIALGVAAKIVEALCRLRSLNRMLDVELDKIKFGPEGERSRRETAERIGRIRCS